MRIPFPERIPVYGAAIFAVLLAAVQRVEGTPGYFCIGSMLFILIATLAFNTAGGLTRSSGAYILFYSMLVFIIGVTYKAFLGEPADRNLSDPQKTIEVFVGGISAMLVAALLSRRFRRSTGILDNVLRDSQMYRASIGSMAAGIAGASVIGLVGLISPSVVRLESAFTQLNQLIPLGIILAVIYEIRSSGGRSSVNSLVVVGSLYYFIYFGLFGFSKQGMLTPLLCWFGAAWLQQYRFKRNEVLFGVVAIFIMFRYLTPYAQYGRGNAPADANLEQKAELALQLLEHPEQTRNDYYRAVSESRGLNSYYDSPQGFWDRLQFISVDDALINITDQGKVFGLLPIKAELLNAIPHILWPGKPSFHFGNVYAHEIGNFSAEDTTTGISFSPTGEAYHLALWTGVLLIAPILWFALFTVYDSLFGDLRVTPWGLLAVTELGHVAPEGGITGVIHLLTFGTETFVFCALFAAWAAPVISAWLLGPGKRRNAMGSAAWSRAQ